MIKTKYILFAKSVVIDQRTSQVSINNIIEELHAENLPSVLSDSHLIIGFEKDSNDSDAFSFKLSLSLNNNQLGEQNISADFKKTKRNRTIISFPILQLSEYGILKFDIFNTNNEIIASYKLDIVAAQIKESVPSY